VNLLYSYRPPRRGCGFSPTCFPVLSSVCTSSYCCPDCTPARPVPQRPASGFAMGSRSGVRRRIVHPTVTCPSNPARGRFRPSVGQGAGGLPVAVIWFAQRHRVEQRVAARLVKNKGSKSFAMDRLRRIQVGGRSGNTPPSKARGFSNRYTGRSRATSSRSRPAASGIQRLVARVQAAPESAPKPVRERHPLLVHVLREARSACLRSPPEKEVLIVRDGGARDARYQSVFAAAQLGLNFRIQPPGRIDARGVDHAARVWAGDRIR